MNNVHDIKKLKQYRESKAVLPHLEKILLVLTLTEKSLSHFSGFMPVAKVLKVVREEKTVIQIYIEKYKKILLEKGLR